MVALPAVWVDLRPAIALLNPKKDIVFDVRVRKEWAGRWMLLMLGSKARVSLDSG